MQDRNELSLSSLRVGYDFWKHNFIKKVAMERLRIEFYMNDVFMLSSIKTEKRYRLSFCKIVQFCCTSYILTLVTMKKVRDIFCVLLLLCTTMFLRELVGCGPKTEIKSELMFQSVSGFKDALMGFT